MSDSGSVAAPNGERDPLSPPPEEAESYANDMVNDSDANASDDDDDNLSQLSEVDEAQFDDFDAANVDLSARQAIPIDDGNLKLVGVHKRKRTEGDEESRKKKKEARREKPKRSRKKRDGSEPFSGGEEIDGKRSRKSRPEPAERRRKAAPAEVDDETLPPEQRRKNALDRAIDNALRGANTRRRKHGDIDLDALADQEIEEMRTRMAKAAEADTDARAKGQPASHKLAMLPQVVALLNRNTLRMQIVDPDINLLESVRFFLEPLNDGSLPAYNIQKELFASLGKLPINKEVLMSSGIGKVVLFYTKSLKAEPVIKRQAERLMTRWTTILKRSDDYRKGIAPAEATAVDPDGTSRPVALPNRGRVQGAGMYSIAPRSNLPAAGGVARPGAAGDAYLRRMKQKNAAKAGRR